jgi:hypothetical protein
VFETILKYTAHVRDFCYNNLMNQWSINRKRFILALIILILAVLVGAPIFLFFHKAPSCFDKLKNGDETGVDCGGSCSLVCTTDTLPLIMKGDPRVIRVATSTYEVVAYIQNPNVSADILNAPYTFNIYGANSPVPVKIITGETFVPKNASFGIFQGPFNIVGAIPSRVTFNWADGALVWQKDLSAVPDLKVTDALLTNTDFEPRLEANLSSSYLNTISNIELVTFIYDDNGNTVGASRTFVDTLNVGETAPLVFTWPAPFVGKSATFDIIPRILPNKSYIQ